MIYDRVQVSGQRDAGNAVQFNWAVFSQEKTVQNVY